MNAIGLVWSYLRAHPRLVVNAIAALAFLGLGWWLRGCREPVPVEVVIPGRIDQGTVVPAPDDRPKVQAPGPVLADDLTDSELQAEAEAAGHRTRRSQAPGSPRSDRELGATGASTGAEIAPQREHGREVSGESAPLVTARLRKEILCQAEILPGEDCPAGSPQVTVTAWRLEDGTVDLTGDWRPLVLKLAPELDRWEGFVGIGAAGSCAKDASGTRVCDLDPVGMVGFTYRPLRRLAVRADLGIGQSLEPIYLAGVGYSF